MTINDNQKNLFIQNPDSHLLRIDEKNQLFAEKKGIWTWLKANTFWRAEYDLKKITDAVKNNLETQDLNFLAVLNMKVKKYNSGDRHSVKIVDFTLLIDQKAKEARVESYRSAKEAVPKQDELEVFIRNSIVSHFRPYLEGKITEANENKNRQPITTIILQKLRETYPAKVFDEKKVREIVLESYFRVATVQFCTAFRQNHHASYPTEGEIEPLVRALKHSSAIDFKELPRLPEKVEAIVKQAYKEFRARPDTTTSPAG